MEYKASEVFKEDTSTGTSTGMRPSVESLDILLIKGGNQRKINIKSDMLQPDYKLQGLPDAYEQSIVEFSDFAQNSANVCTVTMLPPNVTVPRQEIFFGSSSARNWRGKIFIETISAPPISLADLKTMIASGEDVTRVNTSQITDMSYLFYNNHNFNQDISAWDTSKVTDMSYMFNGASSFNQDISAWDTSNVTDMSYMFSASAFDQNINSWDTSKVGNMYAMFYANKVYNKPLSSWNTYSVYDMSYMFGEATKFNQSISDWDVANVNTTSFMFTKTNYDQDMSKWRLRSNVLADNMYTDCPIREEYKARKPITLTELKAKIANDEDVRYVNTSYLTDMSYLFQNKTEFNQDISKWDISRATTIRGMFINAHKFNQDISSWDTSNVIHMGDMFHMAKEFNQDIGAWDTSKVINMANMFTYTQKFNQDISGWDVSNATNIYGMFQSANSFNQNIGGWDVSRATSMAYIFDFAASFDQDLSKWDINEDAWAADAFRNCPIREEYKFVKP